MCAGIEFNGRRVLFAEPSPQLPILLKGGAIDWAPWGKPFAESVDKSAPAGGWARLESIQAGKWKRYGAKPVLIVATAFMERDARGEAIWFPVAPGLAIQGAAIRRPNATLQAEQGLEVVRVYVVTVPALGDVAEVHDRMPRLVRRTV